MLHVLYLSALLTLLPLSSVWAAPMCSLRPRPSSSAIASAPSPTPSVSGGVSNGGGNGTEDFVATTWYAGWHATDFPPSSLSWKKYTSATYAFAVTTNDGGVSLEDSDEQVLPTFVDAAHQNGVKALLTVGGWTGSQYFSSSVGSAANRTAFVNTMVGLVQKYNLDGLDFDWEYPNKQGLGCNIISSDDSANFLSFLQELRTAPEISNLTLSAAVSITPFAGSDGTPMSDVSDFAKVLDYVAIMDYDVFGSWSPTVGPNAPLDDSCAAAADQQGSAKSAVKAWTAANFPANQLVLGVASYGHSFSVSQSDASASAGSGSAAVAAQPSGTTAISLYPQYNKAQQPLGDKWDSNGTSTDACGVTTSGPSGIFDFFGLIEGGFLTANGTAADGMGFVFDECSQTPFIYNPNTQVMVSYDDPQSFAAKGQYIEEAGLLGFAMWEAAGDSNDLLLDSISQAMGIEQKSSRR